MSHITIFSRCEIFEKKIFKFSKKKISSNLAKLCTKKAISKNLKKKIWKKKKILKSFFWKNRYEIANKRQIEILLTVANRQDFELSRTHWLFAFELILLKYAGKKPRKIFQKKFFWKKLFFEHYFSFLIGFTCTNNLSMVLLLSLLKKFLCDMHTQWALTHLKTAVCS